MVQSGTRTGARLAFHAVSVIFAGMGRIYNLDTWRSISAAVEAKELRSPFEALARPVYALLAVQGTVTLVALYAQGFRIEPAVWALLLPWPFMAAGGMALRRLGIDRLATALETFAVIHWQALACSFLIVSVTPYAPPYADELLASWDQALRFPWADFVDVFRGYPEVMAGLYDTFLWQSPLLIAMLAWKGLRRRTWMFVTAATVSLTICTVAFMYLPAKAPYIYYGIPELAGQSAGTRFLEPVEYIRNGGREFTLRLFSGCITFPSYHAVCALLYCWAAWPTTLRWPTMLINAGMLVGAMVIGGHYFIDLPAGFIVAIVSLLLSSRLIKSGQRAST